MAKKKSMDKTPRVNIVYDVYTGGAKEERELPFVVGVLADLSGDPETPLPRLRDRKFVEIDKNTFDSVLAAVRPRIKIDVPNTLAVKIGERVGLAVNQSDVRVLPGEPV